MESIVLTIAITLGVIVGAVIILVIGGIVLSALSKGWEH